MRCIHQKQTHPQIRPIQVSANRVISLRPLRFDLDVDRDRLADSRHCFGCGGKHQIEVASRDWFGRNRPPRSARFIYRRQQFHMKCDRSGHTVHGEIAEDVAALRSGSLDASAPERDLGKFFDVKEFRTAKMVVSFFSVRINAAHVDLRGDRGILRMFAIDFNSAAEAREFAASGAKELMNTEPNGGPGRIELVALLC